MTWTNNGDCWYLFRDLAKRGELESAILKITLHPEGELQVKLHQWMTPRNMRRLISESTPLTVQDVRWVGRWPTNRKVQRGVGWVNLWGATSNELKPYLELSYDAIEVTDW